LHHIRFSFDLPFDWFRSKVAKLEDSTHPFFVKEPTKIGAENIFCCGLNKNSDLPAAPIAFTLLEKRRLNRLIHTAIWNLADNILK